MEDVGERENPEEKPKMPHAFALMPSKAPLQLFCEWGECQAYFTEMHAFRTHVQSHLWDLFNNVKGTENECEMFLNIACDWRQCDSEAGRGFAELVRHVYFHAFHSKLKSVGSYIVQVRNAPACKLEDISRNVIPELPEQLICHWGDCEEIHDDPSLFYEHCNSHIEELPASKHPPGGVRCRWDGCEQSVQNRHRMREHLRSHTQERIVACATCGTLFANNTKLMDHLLRQRDISDGFQCSHCSKAFGTERLLRDHMRNHVNNYKCPLCDMTCPSPANLRTHLNTRHSENRPHVCNLCPKKYKLASDLRKHQEMAHSAATYACHIGECRYVCASYKLLLVHFKREHEEDDSKRRYRCHLCDSEYTRGGLLTNHLKKAHNFQWPPGHQRFRYRQNSDGIYQLQTLRYESLELSEQILTDDVQPDDGTHKSPGKDKKMRFRSVRAVEQFRMSNSNNDRNEEESCQEEEEDEDEGDYSYNLEMLGDVALQQESSLQTRSRSVAKSGAKDNSHKGNKSRTSVAGQSGAKTTGKSSGNMTTSTQQGLLNARRKLCMDFDSGNTTGASERPVRANKRGAKSAPETLDTSSSGKKPRKSTRKRDLSTVIETLVDEKRFGSDSETTPIKLQTASYMGYADSVVCMDKNATINANSTEKGGMEITWTSEGKQNLEIDLPESFNDCDSVVVSYDNEYEREVPLMNMPVVIFGDEVHHRKQRTPVKVISHDKM